MGTSAKPASSGSAPSRGDERDAEASRANPAAVPAAGQPSPRDHPRRPGDEHRQPLQRPGGGEREAVHAHEEGDGPGLHAVDRGAERRGTEEQRGQGARIPAQVGDEFAERRVGHRGAGPVAFRLPHGEHQRRQGQARQPDPEKDRLPGEDRLPRRQRDRAGAGRGGERPAEQRRETRSDGAPRGEEPARAGDLPRREQVGDHRVRGRGERRLPDPDRGAREQQFAVPVGQRRGRGREAPGRDPGGRDRAPRAAVDEAAEQQAEQDVGRRERRPHQQAQLRVAEREVALERDGEREQHGAVEERRDLRQHEHGERGPGTGAGGGEAGWRRRGGHGKSGRGGYGLTGTRKARTLYCKVLHRSLRCPSATSPPRCAWLPRSIPGPPPRPRPRATPCCSTRSIPRIRTAASASTS